VVIGGGDRGSPYGRMGEVVDQQSFPLSRYLLAKRTADPERSSPIYYTSIDAVSANDMP
jgi:hypothetical protein